MSVIRIASRYAKSLIELAGEQGKMDVVHADIQTLQAAAKNRDLYMLLKSPIVKADKKNAVLRAVFSGQLDKLTMSYVELLVNKGREQYLPEITAEFLTQYKLLKKITTVRVVTAETLSEGVVDDIRKKIVDSGVATPNVEINTAVDPDLIGGFVLDFDNKRYDASVAHKLDEMRDLFTKNLYVREF